MHVTNLGLLVRGLTRIQGHKLLVRRHFRDLPTRSGLANGGQDTASRRAELPSFESAGQIVCLTSTPRVSASTRDRASDPGE